ncbi:PREDICTED: homeobox-leucine zipper protein HAT22-like [Populus euphratica]|uniref:Homeobox-leucine zipper protein HAT22-like n=1 Tax=Populus euphratica TaxID=75702 RepID=A0AAJ6TBP6_POPEU|nr:PREDICTED: homeobox-leucine zipper protein HAT22-like [Populus euphratica]
MGCLDDGCTTGLVLGLGFAPLTDLERSTSKPGDYSNRLIRPQIKPSLKFDHNPSTSTSFELSLSLVLSSETYSHAGSRQKTMDGEKGCEESIGAHDLLYRQASPDQSAVSSFSSGRVKRERDLGCEDIEVERISSRVSDEDEDGTNARKKLRLTKEQSALLEESFKQHSNLYPKQKEALARQLNLRPRQVEVWFQNRRARTKLKQTEVDCEFLKKCCEALKDENGRLQKELQELKALKLAQPFYMHMPAATLTMCPSCERIGGVGDGASKSSFSMVPKPDFYNTFTNPSAAC